MVKTASRRVPAVPDAAWCKALPPAVRIAFYGDTAAQSAAEPLWGPAFSQQACRANVSAMRATLWLGPEEYLLLSMDGADSVATVISTLESVLTDIPHALVDVSHRQFAFEITGPHAATILNGACPLDLDLGAFPVGMCTRTILAKADIVLWRTAATAFHVEAWRSFAGYVTGILHEIAAGI